MKANLLIITGIFITEDFVLASALFERNTLSQNIDLVKKKLAIEEILKSN